MFKGEWNEVATLLRNEHDGMQINQGRLNSLAQTLLPHFPEMRNTLNSIARRTSGSHQ